MEPAANVIEIIVGDNEKGYSLLKMYMIVQIPSFSKCIVISFDNFFSPSFQGINIHDVFPDYDMAFEYIRKTNKVDDNFLYNITCGIAVAGYIEQSYLLLIEKAVPIKFQDQEIIYKVQSFKKIRFQKENWKQNAAISCPADDFYFSFESNILFFQEKKNNMNYNYLHLNQKPFRRLQVNVCPFIINGYIKRKKISDISEILLICRCSSSSKTIAYGMNEDGITRNQAEIEMVVSEKKNDGVELSSFTVSFGDIPYSYKINDIKGQIFYEIGENSFLNTPKLIYNLLGDRKEKIKNDVFLIDLVQEPQKQQNNKLNEAMRKMVNFLSGVFSIHHIKFDCNIDKDENEIFDEIYSLLPNIKILKQIFYNSNFYLLNDADQVFYAYSNYGNLNAEFVSLLLLSKAFKMIFPKIDNPERFLFTLISPFYKKFVNSIKTNLPFLKELVESHPNKAPEVENFAPPLNMERCVSLFPAATIIEPSNVDHHILSLFTTHYFYKSPEKSLVINLTEVCRISRILFMPANNTKTGNVYNITPSMVSVYGGLYLNQMFPIVENLVLAPTVETSFVVNLKKNNFYSTELKYSKYGMVRFVTFRFSSPFEAFYISNIYVFTDGSKVLEFPKKLKNQNFDVLENGYEYPFLENECKRIENQESNQLFVFKNHDKIKDIINVDSYFNSYSNSKKTEEQINSFNDINNNLIENELIMMNKKYPFLRKSFKLKSNFMKYYSYNSLHVPFLVASGPPLFEYVNSQISKLEDFKIFQPTESVVFLKVVLLQSYSLESIEVKCNSPLLIEILDSNNLIFSNIFEPPGNVLPFFSDERVFGIKLIGNPISISFLGFKPRQSRVSNEINGQNSIDYDRANVIKCKQKDYNIIDSKIENLNPSMKIIGIKLNRKHFANLVPQYFLFDNRAMFVKMNPSSTFFFPEIISCSSIKIFIKGHDKNQKIFSNAVIIVLNEKQEIDGQEIPFAKAIQKMPQSIQILGNSSSSPLNILELFGSSFKHI